MTFRLIFSPEQLAQQEANRPGPAVKVDRWYDHTARVWTAFLVDAKGNQRSDAQHAHRKEWLSLKVADYDAYDD